MTEFLTSDKLRYYQELFAQMDYFSTGKLAAQQLHQVLRSMHIRLSYDDVVQLVKQTGNITDNVEISLSEFLAIISIVIQDKDFNEEIYQVFKVFDIDKNKMINFKDFQAGFQRLDIEISTKDLLDMLEATGKNQFSLKEFRQFVLDK